jgi:cytochrome c biogenesis protein ResB
LPLVVGALAQFAGPVISNLLGRESTAGKAVEAVTSVASAITGASNPEQALEQIRVDKQLQVQYATAMAAKAAELAEAEARRLESVNETMRKEITSGDGYVRRWRPTFGYLTGFGFFGILGSIVYTIVTDPAQAPTMISALAEMEGIWMPVMAVLGISVWKRSSDKQVGQPKSPGVLGAVIGKLVR